MNPRDSMIEGSRRADELSSRRTTVFLGIACVVMLWLAGRGILSEATISLQGDMPRYLLNGVFVHDLLRDHPIAHPLEYTYRYYARYPALSLGHHPPLLPVVEAPFFALFGVSVATGRVVILGFAVLAVVVWFFIVRDLFDRDVAFAATMLFATAPFVVDYARVVLSEIPALALMLVAVWTFLRYADTLRTREAMWFAGALGLSVYAKQHTLFILPVLLVHLAFTKGLGAVFRRETITACFLVAVIIAPLVPVTLEFSRANVAWVSSGSTVSRLHPDNLLYYAGKVRGQLVSTPAVVMAGFALVACLWKRDWRVCLFIFWIIGLYGELTYTGALETRYAIFLIPPFLGLAAAMIAAVSTGWARSAMAGILISIVVYQAVVANAAVPEFAEGYERAAQYVIDHPLGESVLYSANVDSGFFVFFVRKHDHDGDLVVLRADKILATSSLGRIIADEIQTREQLYEILRALGVGYIVIEDAAYKSPALELLRTEVQSSAFALRARIPIRAAHNPRLQGVDLAIYEYLERQPARSDAPLRMRIPLMGGGVNLTFGDLLGKK